MNDSMAKKAMSTILLGVIPFISSAAISYAMDPAQPPESLRQTDPIFLGLETGDNGLIAYEAPHIFQQFSSERLAYSLPDGEMGQKILNLALMPEIYKSLFVEDESLDCASQLIHNLIDDSSEINTNAKKNQKCYRLPDGLVWGVTLKETNEFAGLLICQFKQPYVADQVAPEGDLHQFYVDDIRKNTYVNMAYAVHPDHQRRGYATEMSLALIEVLFSHTNAEVILHTSYRSNIGSGKSAEICCFKEKGIKHGEVFRILRKSSQLLPSMKIHLLKSIK